MTIEGLPESPIKGIEMKNVQIDAAKGGKVYYAEIVTQGLVVKAQSGPPMMAGAGAKGSLK